MKKQVKQVQLVGHLFVCVVFFSVRYIDTDYLCKVFPASQLDHMTNERGGHLDGLCIHHSFNATTLPWSG